jgi:aryl-alcohol dehydrogenase-like predicted oxidoreductase
MEYVNLGNTGLKVSRICLGTMTYGSSRWRKWVLDEKESVPFIRRALELGINFFDTADMYSDGASEEVLGHALKECGVARDKVVIASKVFNPMGDDPNQRGLGRKHIRHAIDASLQRLGLDYLDLYQIHRFDPHTPIEETIEALSDLVDEGKVLYLGASSMWAWQFATMLHTADQLGLHRFSVMQNHYNLLYREEEREMMPLCEAEGIGVIPWSPLARGVLTGNKQANTTRANSDDFATKLYQKAADADARVLDDLRAVAQKRGVPPAQIALAWLLHQPALVAPIVGASKMPHLEDAVAAAALELSDEEIATLERSYVPHEIAGHE